MVGLLYIYWSTEFSIGKFPLYWLSTSKLFLSNPNFIILVPFDKWRGPAQYAPFSINHLIWVNYKILSQLFQPIFLSCLYLHSARHISVIELCREPILFNFGVQFYRKVTYSYYAIDFFFNDVDFHIYLFREFTLFWLNKSTSLSE